MSTAPMDGRKQCERLQTSATHAFPPPALPVSGSKGFALAAVACQRESQASRPPPAPNLYAIHPPLRLPSMESRNSDVLVILRFQQMPTPCYFTAAAK